MTHDRPTRPVRAYRYYLARAWREVGKPTSVFRLFVVAFSIGLLALYGSGQIR